MQTYGAKAEVQGLEALAGARGLAGLAVVGAQDTLVRKQGLEALAGTQGLLALAGVWKPRSVAEVRHHKFFAGAVRCVSV